MIFSHKLHLHTFYLNMAADHSVSFVVGDRVFVEGYHERLFEVIQVYVGDKRCRVRGLDAGVSSVLPVFWIANKKLKRVDRAPDVRAPDVRAPQGHAPQGHAPEEETKSHVPCSPTIGCSLEDLQCCVCFEVTVQDIWQCMTGAHFVCTSCRNSMLTANGDNQEELKCPIDRSKGLIPSFFVKKLLEPHLAPCQYKPQGCVFRHLKSSSYLADHESKCVYQPRNCMWCHKMVHQRTLSELLDHFLIDCHGHPLTQPGCFSRMAGEILLIFERLHEDLAMFRIWAIKSSAVDQDFPQHIQCKVTHSPHHIAIHRLTLHTWQSLTRDTASVICIPEPEQIECQYMWKDGDTLDVEDTRGIFCKGIIKQTMRSDNAVSYLISYLNFSSRWDEWILYTSSRLQLKDSTIPKKKAN